MSDLSFTAIQSKLPSGAMTAASGDITISLKAVMGEASVALTDQKVGEFVSKFLDACAAAQNDWNAINTPKYRSYNVPSASTPYLRSGSTQYSASFTYTTIVDIPLNRDVVDAVEASAVGF